MMISGQQSIIEEEYRIELIRKSIHLCSHSIPILYLNVQKNVALAVFIPLTAIFLAVDIARYYHGGVEAWFYGTFGWLLRRHESDKVHKTLNGATYVLVAATLCIFFFPKIIAVTSFSILIISDITAALVGRRFGRHRFLAKSLEGSSAFFLSALLVVAATPKLEYSAAEYLIGVVAAAVGAVVEALPVKLDDNLTIPISVGLVMWGLYSLCLPGLNINTFR
jgi:dolichol kinase